jgi:hypothetical protein
MPELVAVLEAKQLVERGDLTSLKAYIEMVTEEVDEAYLFHRVFLHACLKKKQEIVTWLQEEYFKTMDPIQQIALRQIFPYGRHLLNKR